jgi:hypothetical protein
MTAIVQLPDCMVSFSFQHAWTSSHNPTESKPMCSQVRIEPAKQAGRPYTVVIVAIALFVRNTMARCPLT